MNGCFCSCDEFNFFVQSGFSYPNEEIE